MKNMTQNRFFIQKYVILGIKVSKNEIWKFLKVIYLNIKNVLKMFWMQFLLQGASLSIIPQKSSIGQKFLTPCILKKIKINEGSKIFWNMKIFWWHIDVFWGNGMVEISDRSLIFGVWCSVMLPVKGIASKVFLERFLCSGIWP